MKKTTVMLLAVAAVSLPAAAGSETLNLVPWPKHMELGRGFLALTLSSRLYKLIAIIGLGVVALVVLPLISRQTPAE